MPKGKPKAGFRRTAKWKARSVVESIQNTEQGLADKLSENIAKLESLTKPIECPNCGRLIPVIDKDVCMYLVNRVMGMPKQKQEVDVTENIQLDADQIDNLLWNKFGFRIEDVMRAKYLIEQGKLIPEGKVIESEVKEIPDTEN